MRPLFGEAQHKPFKIRVHVNCGVKRERDTKSVSGKVQHKPFKRKVHVNCRVKRKRDTKSASGKAQHKPQKRRVYDSTWIAELRGKEIQSQSLAKCNTNLSTEESM